VRRVGIVGCGVISKAYAEKLAALPFLDLVACADLERARAEKLAKDHGIPRVLSTEELLRDPEVDVVVNLTIPAAHAAVSQAALDAGKHVYSEKPLALDVAAGRRLADTAARRGLRLGCAPDTFLGAGLQTCRKLIDDGAIGEVVAANGFMQSPGPESWHPRPRIFYQRGAGPLLDVGVYYVTALVALLGPVRRVTSGARITHARRVIKSEPCRGEWMDVEEPTHVASVLEHASGPIATLVTSFDVQASRLRNIEIYGTEGTLACPDPNTFGGAVQIRRAGAEEWADVPYTHANAAQSRGIGLADMAIAAASGRAHRASGALALHVLEVMERALAASREGRHQPIESFCERPAPLPAGLADDEFED
jgi:predicted dehydrogenase